MNPAAPRSRGGYGRLDRTVILDAALRVASRPGVRDIRFRDLGEELDADPTAVYRHFRNKGHLMAGLIDRLMDGVAHELPPDAGWRALLHSIAERMFDTFARYPAIGMHLADDRPVGRAELALVERFLRALETAGLRDDVLVEHYGAMSGFAIAYIASTCRQLTLSGGSSAEDAEQMPWLLEQELMSASHPAYMRHREAIAQLDFRSTYLATIRVLADAVGRAGEDEALS